MVALDAFALLRCFDAWRLTCQAVSVSFIFILMGSGALFVEINLDSDFHPALVRKHSPESP